MDWVHLLTDGVAAVDSVGHSALTLSAIVLAIIGAVQATRWGRSQKISHARELASLVQQIARVVVDATEQWAARCAKDGAVIPGRAKKLRATTLARTLLPTSVPPEQVDVAIEAAVRERK